MWLCIITSLCVSDLTLNIVAVSILQYKYFLMPHLSSAQQGLV